MKCPNCNETLLITERKNVEIDYCPSCRGVWLDKGELDKIIEFSNESQVAPPPPPPYPENTHKPTQREDDYRRKYDDDDDDDDYKRKEYNKTGQKKKSSFLGDLFDF